VSKDAVFVFGLTDCDIAVAKRLSRDDVLGYCLEVKQARLVNIWLWNNASWWALVNDSCSCGKLEREHKRLLMIYTDLPRAETGRRKYPVS
jgi:hypothetical protein